MPPQLAGVREIPDLPVRSTEQAWATPPSTPRTISQLPPDERAAFRAGVLGAINVMAQVLGGRALVLVSVVGAVFLTWTVLQSPDPYKLIALGVYMLAPVSTVWLASR